MDIKAFARDTLRRLRQPTAMAGIAALALLLGMPAGSVDLIGQVIVGVAALLAIWVDDKSNAAPAAPGDVAIGAAPGGSMLDQLREAAARDQGPPGLNPGRRRRDRRPA